MDDAESRQQPNYRGSPTFPTRLDIKVMRGFAYAIAAIAAVGIMIVIASIPSESTSGPSSSAPTEMTSTAADAMPAAGTLTFNVPEMHCEFACYPQVKATLENSSLVNSVELAPQKEQGVIDNRQVIVNHKAGFSATEALKWLEKEGFSDSELVH